MDMLNVAFLQVLVDFLSDPNGYRAATCISAEPNLSIQMVEFTTHRIIPFVEEQQDTLGGPTLCDRLQAFIAAASSPGVLGRQAFLYARAAERLSRIGPWRV